MDEKTKWQAEFFANRIRKRASHLKKWAKRENVGAFRIYDRDIPEIPLRLDFFCDGSGEKFAILSLFERPYEKPEKEEREWLDAMRLVACEILQIPEQNVEVKIRKRQRGDSQYEKISDGKRKIAVSEGECRFWVNLSDYLDCGLFFDLRSLREKVRQNSLEKSVLNLFCYTGSFSVCAAKGGAKKVVSVDLSAKYLEWAQENFLLNGLKGGDFRFVKSDVGEFLRKTCEKFDIIILDPPAFSNSKSLQDDFDLQHDWADLARLCGARLSQGGVLYFSANTRKFKFDEGEIAPLCAREISKSFVPPDFEGRFFHKIWKIWLP